MPTAEVIQGGPQTAIPMPKIVLVPGLEFDPSRKYRYGMHALAAGVMLFISFVIVEIRDCNWGFGVDLDKLQGLHISLMIFALVLYLLSLFGIADYVFKYRVMFLIGVLLIYTIVALMIWMTYEAAVNPCKKSSTVIPVDFTFGPNKNVFNTGDAYGIIVLLLDILATVFMFSAAANFWKRY